jgi:hypothetical protein
MKKSVGSKCPPYGDPAFSAQERHTQAVRRAFAGTLSSSSAPKSTCVHQQGGCATPVARSTSIAHRLGCPHKGQRVGSGAWVVRGMGRDTVLAV